MVEAPTFQEYRRTAIDEARDRLHERFEKWLLAQPEWPLLTLDDRQARRREARKLAKRIETIPQRSTSCTS